LITEYRNLTQNSSIHSNNYKSSDIILVDERDEIILEQDKKIKKLSFLTHKLDKKDKDKDNLNRNASNSLMSVDSRDTDEINNSNPEFRFTFSG